MVWLILSTQASSAGFVPADLPMSLYWSNSFGSSVWAAGRVPAAEVAAQVLDAVMHRLAQQDLGVFHADDAGQGPGAVRQDDAVDLQFLLHGGQKLVEGVDGFSGAGEGGENPLGGG